MEEGRFRFLKSRSFKSAQNKEFYMVCVLDLLDSHLDYHVEKIFVNKESFDLTRDMAYNDVIDSYITFIYDSKDECYKIAFNNNN